jgi:hypothetical protein
MALSGTHIIGNYDLEIPVLTLFFSEVILWDTLRGA